MTHQEVLMSLEINGRKEQIEVKTMTRGSGRHNHYASLRQAPPEVRGQVLELIRNAVVNAGYSSLADLESALTSELVVPEKEDEEGDKGGGADDKVE